MATFKAVIFKQRKHDDGSFDIKIRVTQNRIQKYLATPFKVTQNDITKLSLKPGNDLRITNYKISDDVADILKRYRDICNDLGERIRDLDIDQLTKLLQAKNDMKHGFYLDFIAYGNTQVTKMKDNNRAGTAGLYNTMLNSLVAFTGRSEISIQEITVRFMEDFEKWLKTRDPKTKREKGTRAVSLYPGLVRSLHNMAKKELNDEDLGIINIPYSPFKKYHLAKETITRKRALPGAKIKTIAELPYKNVSKMLSSRFNLAKDVFLLSFSLIGINSADLFTCKKIKKGWITYERAKTKDRRDDNAEISILIQPEIASLVEKYRDKTGSRVFNFYQNYHDKGTFNAAVNKGLKQIGKLDAIGEEDLEFYAARHSWATIASNDVKIDKYTVHMALNHVSKEMQITDRYIKKDYSLINDANRKVLDYLDFKIEVNTEPNLKKIDQKVKVKSSL